MTTESFVRNQLAAATKAPTCVGPCDDDHTGVWLDGQIQGAGRCEGSQLSLHAQHVHVQADGIDNMVQRQDNSLALLT